MDGNAEKKRMAFPLRNVVGARNVDYGEAALLEGPYGLLARDRRQARN
jgi:hypothetical protein